MPASTLVDNSSSANDTIPDTPIAEPVYAIDWKRLWTNASLDAALQGETISSCFRDNMRQARDDLQFSFGEEDYIILVAFRGKRDDSGRVLSDPFPGRWFACLSEWSLLRLRWRRLLSRQRTLELVGGSIPSELPQY